MTPRKLTLLTVLAAVLGLYFATYSTYDFVGHLDREVHAAHCSFVPGLAGAEAAGTGCHATMMSRYSSIFRSALWGGIPMSLLGMSTFAFLAAFGGYLVLARRDQTLDGARTLLVLWALPVLTSCVMAYFAFVELGAACRLCIGIYSMSALGFAAAAVSFVRLRRAGAADATLVTGPPTMTVGADVPPVAPAVVPSQGRLLLFSAVPALSAFVVAPVLAYVAAMPSYAQFVEGCGRLSAPDDRYGVFVPLSGSVSGRTAIEVLDPLCPSCRGLEDRLEASGLAERLHRKALLFPLDDACNWMLTAAVHPGACAVSEAMLCEPARAESVLDWAFANQETIIAAERARRGAAAAMVTAQFPSTRGCVGSSRIRSQLHRGLRWAVANQLPVQTPQIFLDGVKVCSEDTDLGLEYTVTEMLERPAVQGGTP